MPKPRRGTKVATSVCLDPEDREKLRALGVNVSVLFQNFVKAYLRGELKEKPVTFETAS